MDDLGLLIKSRYPLVTIETREEERVCRVVDEICLELARVPFRWSVTKGLQRSGGSQSVYDTQEPVKALKHISIASIPAVYLMLDFHPYLDEPRVVRLLREILQRADLLNLTLIFASRSIELPGELLEHAASYRLSLPEEAELAQVVRETFRDLNRGGKRAYRLQEAEFALLVRNLKGLTLAEAQRVVSRCVLDDDILDAKDIEAALERKKQHIEKSGLLECVGLGEEETHLGGLASLKGWLRRYSAGFSDQARKLGLRPPRGVLFVGVQGCGKSLAAKTIARQWHLPLVRLDPSQILNKYVGESEKNLRHVFEIVESVAPVVLWIDEIEKAFSNASGNDGDGGLGRRIFGSFLTWMQEKKDGVFVTATANEWAKLPPEFQRKGRFDEVFFIDLPNDKERLDILRIHLQKRNLPIKGIDLARLVRESAGFSGAEIEQVVIASLYSVLEANGKSVTTDQILEEIRKTVPLSRSRKEQVDALRSFAQDRFVSAS